MTCATAYRLAVDGDVDHVRRRRDVVVPDIVMNELLVPHSLAGLRIETHQAAGEQIVARTMAAVEISGRRFDRQILP